MVFGRLNPYSLYFLWATTSLSLNRYSILSFKLLEIYFRFYVLFKYSCKSKTHSHTPTTHTQTLGQHTLTHSHNTHSNTPTTHTQTLGQHTLTHSHNTHSNTRTTHTHTLGQHTLKHSDNTHSHNTQTTLKQHSNNTQTLGQHPIRQLPLKQHKIGQHISPFHTNTHQHPPPYILSLTQAHTASKTEASKVIALNVLLTTFK